MNRRDFLFYAAAGSAALSLPAATLTSARSRPFTPLARPRTIQTIGQAPLVHRLGRTYRARWPDENDPNILASAIRREEPASASSPVAGSDLDAHVDQRIRQDFEAGRTAQLEGWILSVTEVRQCALYSILY
jgi:hypothetical protein